MKTEDRKLLILQVTATVVGGLVLAGILYVLGFFPSLLLAAKGLWKFSFTQISVSGWLLTAMIICSLGFLVLAGRLLYLAFVLPDYVPYVKDTFLKLVWRWTYRGNEINDLRPYCPDCDTLLVAYYDDWAGITTFFCETENRPCGGEHGTIKDICDKVRRQIDRKIRNGEWKNIVATGTN